jgi:molybdopterin-containing oxidoreductase family membrane subunit
VKVLFSFFKDAIILAAKGSKHYYFWMISLLVIILFGTYHYGLQLSEGLAITGMHDHVSWGLYISNFTFLVGLAAAAVMLVLPAYVLDDTDFKGAVLIGEGVAVAALIMCLLFVVVDMGRPDRLWHMLTSSFNFPDSILTWDVIVLNGYLALNIFVPFYILMKHYKGEVPETKKYLPFVLLSVFWAIGIHTVTAFLYAGLKSRPFWNSSILGIRFLASAFSAGPAFIVLALAFIKKNTAYNILETTIDKLGFIITVAAQINLFLLGSEMFKEFYSDSAHSISAKYLFFGYHGKHALVPWIWSAIALNIFATVGLTIMGYHRAHEKKSPKSRNLFYLFSGLLFVGIWIEKGMGLIIPGFLPNPMGEIIEYSPTFSEIAISLGIWAIGLFIMTILIKVAIPIELGETKYKKT